MSHLLTVSRAAHLTGVTRADMQKHIASGALPSHDGMVTTENLLKVFPDVRLEDSGAFERIAKIREEAFGRRIRERILPNQEVLAQRLTAQSEELAEVRRHLTSYHDLIGALRERIDLMVAASPSEQLTALGEFIDQGLAGVLGSDEPADTLEVLDDVLRVMTAHVKVKPSGREFFVEGNETVLEAALRAGLAPSYGCRNGNCGLCKARIVSGRTKQVHHTDYPLSASERAQGHTLLCSHTAVTDLEIEMLEANLPSDIPEQEIVATVRKIEPLATDIMLLHLQTPRTSRLRFLAGQRVTLSVSGLSANFRGDYPIASCPCDDRNLHFHICNNPEDDFARSLFAGVIKANDPVSLFGPFGDFVLRKDVVTDIAFIVCDSGFAPAKSLIESAVAADMPGALQLIWAATRDNGHYLENQCRAWADALDTFSFFTLKANDRPAAGAAAVTRLLAEAGSVRREVYVSGPADFVEAACKALMAGGLPAAQLHYESS
ncbi:MAG: 2Fe-2S iron-sulfur cluster binding domain-containing protein [Gammaproteobacteria bacterium]|nr:2Fe-2S iron-sulfur cluster binding domain-containing protein [Rhodocyclaceae bacterium]MBU3908371.1 2Fe-2S iron-sulfur cluster binding domain-containing protein [Gammaproteobacteria bacterium]MBU3987880.1 2Fe-2S iron-sulfur cluster binding domain-containing protein [Gammaproteobacteria bacterium]MBU4004081.1 2Fe-2S iron-sulfur cluster binding domain-containing protein [Gammaproteobacteria bacterium]MBU4020328.1 2Fe-2S iron-sulfur cluster binding domain-containing protein [Gammaproteobacteria